MLDEYISKLMPIVKKMCSKEKTGGHDIDHFLRTMKTALYLQKIEGGDPIIIGIASKNDVSALSSESAPTRLSAVTVVPLLEIPLIHATP